MKKKFITGLITILTLITTVWAGDIKPLGHCVQSGLYWQTLGTAATAKDKWQVTCPAGTKSYQVQVRDKAPIAAPIVSIKITGSSNAGSSNGAKSDNVDGNGSSAQCTLTGFSSFSTYTLNSISLAPVTFTFEVYKSAAGMEDYDVMDYCRNSAGFDLNNGTSLTNFQNQ